MKKNIALLLLSCLLICCTFGLIACQKDDVHTHTSEKVEAKAATCETAGNIEYYVCKDCGKYFSDTQSLEEITLESTVIAALGHDLEDHDAKAATCTEDGYSAYKTCKREGCDYATESTVIPALAHANKVHHEKVDATCTEAGTIEYWACPDCGKNYSDEVCATVVTELTIAALNHDMKPVEAKEATCAEAGYAAYEKCSRCDHNTKGADIPAIAHANKVHHEKVDATCTEAGTIEYWACPDCGKNYSDEACVTVVTELTIAVSNHDYELLKFTAPTKLTYARGEAIDLTGMSLTVKCADCSDEKDVTDSIVLDKTVAPSVTDNTVTITATYGEITQTFDITLNKRDEVFSCWVGWDTPGDNKHSSSFFLSNPDGYSVGEYQAVAFSAGAKMRFYFYSDSKRLARLSCRATNGRSMHASESFNINIYKPTTEGQDLSTLTPDLLSVDKNAYLGSQWGDFTTVTYLGTISLQKGWNVIEVDVTKTNGADFDFRSMMLDYITSDTTEITVVDEVFSCWIGGDTPGDNKHTASFFLSNSEGYSVGEYQAAGFSAGAKMRFYFYSVAAAEARLSCRAATGAGGMHVSEGFNVNLYKPTTEGQDLSTLTAESVVLDTGASLAGNSWDDFSNQIFLGTISIQKGWNVVEIDVTKANGRDFNFRSVTLEYSY